MKTTARSPSQHAARRRVRHAHRRDDRLDATFGALAHPARRGILGQLRRGEASVSDLAAPYGMSLPAISRHLKVLESAGLIARTVEGRFHRCRLVPEAADEAARWLEDHRRFWAEQLDGLARYVESLGSHDGSSAQASGDPSAEDTE